VNQDTHLFNESVLYNMKYGTTADDETVIKFLKEYNLDSVFSELSDGIHGSVGINGGNLSGGMQKITMLTRGILKSMQEGTTLILDEPLVGLDEKTVELVLYMLKCSSMLCVIITHDMRVLSLCEKVLRM